MLLVEWNEKGDVGEASAMFASFSVGSFALKLAKL
jgi:hypothetical protein